MENNISSIQPVLNPPEPVIPAVSKVSYFAELQGKAKVSDWITRPMSNINEKVAVEWRFTKEKFEEICKGSVPKEMEDHWFTYQQEDHIYFHRSWTGCMIWDCHFRPEGNDWMIDNVTASTDPADHSMSAADSLARLKSLLGVPL